jgi:hypothetical protein
MQKEIELYNRSKRSRITNMINGDDADLLTGSRSKKTTIDNGIGDENDQVDREY